MQDVIGKGFYVRSCSIHDNFQRCVAVHDSSGILVQVRPEREGGRGTGTETEAIDIF